MFWLLFGCYFCKKVQTTSPQSQVGEENPKGHDPGLEARASQSDEVSKALRNRALADSYDG